jgi:hypothetical protein
VAERTRAAQTSPHNRLSRAAINECGALEIDEAQLTGDLEAGNPISYRRSIHRRHSAAEKRPPSSRERDPSGCLLWWKSEAVASMISPMMMGMRKP